MSESSRAIASGIDFSPGQIVYAEEAPELKEDLLRVEYPDGKILDVGWYPTSDPPGEYRVFVVSDDAWNKPLIELSTRDVNRLKELIVQAVNSLRPEE